MNNFITLGVLVVSLVFMIGCNKETVIPVLDVPSEINN